MILSTTNFIFWYTIFDTVSLNTEKILSVSLSANVFVSFNVYHKDW